MEQSVTIPTIIITFFEDEPTHDDDTIYRANHDEEGISNKINSDKNIETTTKLSTKHRNNHDRLISATTETSTTDDKHKKEDVKDLQPASDSNSDKHSKQTVDSSKVHQEDKDEQKGFLDASSRRHKRSRAKPKESKKVSVFKAGFSSDFKSVLESLK